jgi:hypothetical protein
MSLPLAGAVLGIDVGYSPTRKSSAVCLLSWTEAAVTWSIQRFRAVEPERTETIRRTAGGARLLAAAFDGPLRRSLDVVGRYRTAERMLTRRLAPIAGKPGQASAPVGKLLNAHANECARIVLLHCDVAPAAHTVAINERAVVEAFPSSFLGLLIADPMSLKARRGDRSDLFFRHLADSGALVRLLSHGLPGRRPVLDPRHITNHDDRAAFVCALTALCIASLDYTAVGDEDGWIILPPAEFVQPWAMEFLLTNAGEEATDGFMRQSAGVTASRHSR